jgi:putative ABC transport system substrate-binding protein
LAARRGGRWRRKQPPTPVIGILHPSSPKPFAERLRAFRQGLKEARFVEGDNVAIEYRWAENRTDRLPPPSAELIRRRVAAIAALGGNVPAHTAKAATTTIPIVFDVGEDPVKLGLVANIARPGGNLTRVNFLIVELAAKRLEVLHELVPGFVSPRRLIRPALRLSCLH